jgi:hypothetical protein
MTPALWLLSLGCHRKHGFGIRPHHMEIWLQVHQGIVKISFERAAHWLVGSHSVFRIRLLGQCDPKYASMLELAMKRFWERRTGPAHYYGYGVCGQPLRGWKKEALHVEAKKTG